jgi:DNA-binding MarR family transcriptional regulator
MGVPTGSGSALAVADAPQAVRTQLCWLLGRANYTFSTQVSAALEGLELTPRAHAVLATAMNGDHTQSELGRIVGLDKTTMVVTLDELEAAGLAERKPSSEDRRVRVIAVTDAGELKVREAERIVTRTQEEVLSVLPEEHREIFLDSLGLLVTGRLAEPVECTHPVRRRSPRAH